MSNYFEKGHAKNVANLLKLKQLIVTFGTTYNSGCNKMNAKVQDMEELHLKI